MDITGEVVKKSFLPYTGNETPEEWAAKIMHNQGISDG